MVALQPALAKCGRRQTPTRSSVSAKGTPPNLELRAGGPRRRKGENTAFSAAKRRVGIAAHSPALTGSLLWTGDRSTRDTPLDPPSCCGINETVCALITHRWTSIRISLRQRRADALKDREGASVGGFRRGARAGQELFQRASGGTTVLDVTSGKAYRPIHPAHYGAANIDISISNAAWACQSSGCRSSCQPVRGRTSVAIETRPEPRKSNAAIMAARAGPYGKPVDGPG